MYRRGPSKVTPAHVKCQKCLKTGHYSYECKATAQERPYIPRPSRTQQLLNPKLAPKLADAAPFELPKKQGVADQQLAKIEAERVRKRDLEREDDESEKDDAPKRMRSASYDSVSTISTRGSPGPSRPLRRQTSQSRSPARRDLQASPHSSVIGRNQKVSPNPAGRVRDVSPSSRRTRRSRSPAGAGVAASPSRGNYGSDDHSDRDLQTRRRGNASRSLSRSVSPEDRRRYRSRSSDRQKIRHDNPRDRGRGKAGRDRHHVEARGPPPSRREQRERSLSPFSRRLAMTQAMNMNR